MRYVLLISALLFYQCAWSADPPEHKGTKVGDPKNASQADKASSSKGAPPINITVTQDNHSAGQECCKDKNDNHEAEWWTARGTVALAFITFGLAVFTYLLWRSTKDLVERTDKTTQTIERAYVQLSHVSNNKSPGLIVNTTSGKCLVSIGIKNHGTTPARITRVFLTKRVSETPLPSIPDYTIGTGELPEQPMEAFLMKDVEIFVGLEFTIDPTDIPLIRERKKYLVVYGFVDYTDQFERDFRGGYARYYVPDLWPNNLIFTTQPRYNYDQERKRGQGNEYA